MTASRLAAKNFIEFLEDNDYNPRSYSGRFMYGRQCVAVELEDISKIMELGMKWQDHVNDLLRDDEMLEYPHFGDISKISVDNMGRDIVVYWRNIEWPSEIPNEEK